MNWTDEYHQKLKTAAEALSFVRSGERVWVHAGCAVPLSLVDALMARAPYLHDVEIAQMLTLGGADYVKPEYEGHFRVNALFIGTNVRGAIAEGRADYTPIFLHEIEPLFSEGQLPLDWVLIQVSPPDSHGYMSLGVGVDCTLTAARHARNVIVEVNSRMPRTLGDSFIHVSQATDRRSQSRPAGTPY